MRCISFKNLELLRPERLEVAVNGVVLAGKRKGLNATNRESLPLSLEVREPVPNPQQKEHGFRRTRWVRCKVFGESTGGGAPMTTQKGGNNVFLARL